MKYLVRVAYDGSKFYGFQRQKDYLTVQKCLEDSLMRVFHDEILIKGAGRTDRGVHALDQCFSFDAPFYIDCESLKKGISRYVNNYICIKSCTIVSDDFHARFSVKKKIYIYKIHIGNNDPLLEDYCLQLNKNLSIRKLRKISKVFIGIHDFNNFVSGTVKNSVSNVYDIKIKRSGDFIYIKFIGSSFYKYMVRNLVGAMLDYEKGKVSITDVLNMLNNPNNSCQLSTAKPNGLYLAKIYY